MTVNDILQIMETSAQRVADEGVEFMDDDFDQTTSSTTTPTSSVQITEEEDIEHLLRPPMDKAAKRFVFSVLFSLSTFCPCVALMKKTAYSL
jgi:hypothetical protein